MSPGPHLAAPPDSTADDSSIHTMGSLHHSSLPGRMSDADRIHAAAGSDDDDDAASVSTRSDADEESAGLVSHLSDESDRAERRRKYEGVGRGNGHHRAPLVRELDGYGDEEDDDDDSDGFPDRPHVAGAALRLKGRSLAKQAWEIAREALPTLVLSLFSLIFSGELLVHLARWPVFVKVDKLFILVPILLNLKGNLEMNLSLRMSTSANIGELDIRRTRETLVTGNLALLQVQALIVSLFAGVLAFVLGVVTPEPEATEPNARALMGTENPSTMLMRGAFAVLRSKTRSASKPSMSSPAGGLSPRRIIHHHPKPPVDPSKKMRNGYFEFVLVIATGMLSASLSSAILGSFMCALVIVARRVGGNPDNIASPLAASLGDLLTLVLMGLLGSVLVHFEGTILATLILGGLVIACGSCFVVTYRNAYVRELLTGGWVPLIVAMFISSGAGLVLDHFVLRFQGFALLAPVVTGLPGACGAIFASRISTVLHSGKGVANSPSRRSAGRLLSKLGITGPTEGWVVPATLLSIGVTIEGLFLLFVWATGQLSFSWPFAVCFMLVSVSAVTVSLFLAHYICLFLWSRDYDPDIYCLPYVSSLVDVIGQALLVLAFSTAALLGDHVTAAVGIGGGHEGL